MSLTGLSEAIRLFLQERIDLSKHPITLYASTVILLDLLDGSLKGKKLADMYPFKIHLMAMHVADPKLFSFWMAECDGHWVISNP